MKNEMIDYEQEFERLWKMYPNKQGKVNSKRDYIKARENGTTYNEVARGLEKYLAYCLRESWYKPKHASTWFHQNCWLDEIDEGEDKNYADRDKFGNIIV